MPDRQPVVVAVISYSDSGDRDIIKALAPYKECYLTFHPLIWVGVPVRVFYLGFDQDSNVKAFGLLQALGSMPFNEAAIYINGVASVRLSKPKVVELAQTLDGAQDQDEQ